jgi:hypothetical protein
MSDLLSFNILNGTTIHLSDSCESHHIFQNVLIWDSGWSSESFDSDLKAELPQVVQKLGSDLSSPEQAWQLSGRE